MAVARKIKTMSVLLFLIVQVLAGPALPSLAHAERMSSQEVLHDWYRLVLELVRHTPNYSPPVASRSFSYLGVTAFEAVATGSDDLTSLAGQLNGLTPVPQREAGKTYDDAIILQSAMAFAVRNYFDHTGPTGQRAMTAMEADLKAKVAEGLSNDVVAASEAYGVAVAQHIFDWSDDDGGADVQNMGFPLKYDLRKGPDQWVPTSTIGQQQLPLLPSWGANRPFSMPKGAVCDLPPPPAYSEDKTSEFYKQALEVFDTKKNLTPEQRQIAAFWADDAMLSSTPPGHWIAIAWQILDRDQASLNQSVETMARLGVTLADAFIGCWKTKYEVNLLRPVTYIRRTMDPKWESFLTTPPFPEYPSGHSTQSGAAATVLTQIFGENFAFEDASHE
ncbi:MAG: hypothetical protein RIR97_330, partial [Pseudomonadota bacterium]